MKNTRFWLFLGGVIVVVGTSVAVYERRAGPQTGVITTVDAVKTLDVHTQTAEANAPSIAISSVAVTTPTQKTSILPVKLPLASPKVISAYPAISVKAVIIIKGVSKALEANSAGEFPRIFVGTKTTTPIKLSFPDAQPGDVVQIEAEDGGQIVDTKSAVLIAKVDDDRSVSFNFATSQDEGMYRIQVRTNGDFKLLTLWAGEPPHYATSN